MTYSGYPGMSDYERKAWRALVEEAEQKESASNRYSEWTQNAKIRAKGVAGKARNAIERIPGAEQAIDVVDATTRKALAGLHTAFVERGLNSVTPSAIFATVEKEGVDVGSYDDVRKLDLKYCDRTVPRRK